MKSTIAAIVSTIAAMVFCLGYFGEFGWYRYEDGAYRRSDRTIIQWSVKWIAVTESGGIRLSRDSRISNPLAPATEIYLGGHYWGAQHTWAPLNTDNFIWKIRLLHWRVSSNFSARRSEYGIRFPIWMAQTVCLIAPLLWLRRRRLRKQPAGFAVITDGGV
jgi:hypothetical protein